MSSFGKAALGMLAALAAGVAMPPEVELGAYSQKSPHRVGKSDKAKAKKKMVKASKKRNRKK